MDSATHRQPHSLLHQSLPEKPPSLASGRWVAMAIGLLGLSIVPLEADTLTVNPNQGTIRLNSGSFKASTTFRGVTISAASSLSPNNVREYYVHGDFELLDGDIVTATLGSTRAVRFVVGNNVHIADGAVLDFGAVGKSGRAGGGAGGSGGSGGGITPGGAGGAGGAPGSFTWILGGVGALPNYTIPLVTIIGLNGSPGRADGSVDGKVGTAVAADQGDPGGSSESGVPGVNASTSKPGTAVGGGAGGPAGPTAAQASGGGNGGHGAGGLAQFVEFDFPQGGRGGGAGGAGGAGDPGKSGNAGSPGEEGDPGRGAKINDDPQVRLVGGSGGSGGGGGGGGGAGSGGSGGGGGGHGGAGGGGASGANYSEAKGGTGGYGGTGTPGTRGGTGGSGGVGGRGGNGGAGGAGGGALELLAYGTIRVAGELIATGAGGEAAPGFNTVDNLEDLLGEDGSWASQPSEGNKGTGGGRGTNPDTNPGPAGDANTGGTGYTGGNGFFTSSAHGGGGGRGGAGGKGGRGGEGGIGSIGRTGGRGGAGSGGTLSLIGASVEFEPSAMLNTSGGVGPQAGGKGRIILAESSESLPGSNQAGVGKMVTGSRPTAPNHHLKATFAGGRTPTLPGLDGGAEAFGLVPGAELHTISDLNRPAGTLAVIKRYNMGDPNLGIDSLNKDYPGHDLVVVFPAADGLLNPKIGVGGTQATNRSTLRRGGYLNDSRFGGSGDEVLTVLALGDAYAFLVPEAATTLSFSSTGEGGLFHPSFNNGDTVYFGTAEDMIVTTHLDEDDGSADGGVGNGTSLREAIIHSDGGAVIRFDPSLDGSTIVLDPLLGELVLNRNFDIGATALGQGLTISGGSAVRLFQVNSGTAVFLHDLTLAGGNAAGSPGNTGGCINNNGILNIEHCFITRNQAPGNGGAICNNGTARLELLHSTLSDNSTPAVGGALHCRGSSTALVVNATFTGNSAGGTGGGAINATVSARVTIANATITGNQAANGEAGGVREASSADVQIKDSIIAGNIGASSPDLSETVRELGNNYTGPTPLLAPLGHYGGPTPTMPPLPGSPVIDMALGDPGVTTDQRGVPRPTGAGPDIGAVEQFFLASPALVDTDNDGIHDLMEGPDGPFPHLTVGVDDSTVDSDGDGSTDAEEIGNRTNPFDSTDRFRVLSFNRSIDVVTGNPSMTLTFATYPGLSYQVETDDTLQNFTPLGDPFIADGFEMTLEVPLRTGRDFVRVRRE